ncbi:MAG TPA: helix-turn-helix domain-containing protein, partial [Chloroflexaceae bacterium]|nr:helix-turn-helix domain-containing protein [Chloroflexaceae bacterium]
MDESFSFGYWLRRQRLARDLRQADLARQLGIARITLRKIEADERRPSLQLLARLADLFALSDGERATLRAVARADLSPAALPLPRQPVGLSSAPAAADAPAAYPPPPDGGRAEQPVPPHAPELALAPRPLPRQLTPFIGRSRELGDLLARLRDPDARLVSVVAPGGMGKTRLALAAAARLLGDPAFPNGVAFAALAPVHAPSGLEPLLADALGLPLSSADRSAPRAQLLGYLRRKQLLLVLDNCEHVREAVVTLLRALLEHAPGVTVLTTSRERLGLRVEHVLPLDGMESDLGGAMLFATTARNVRLAFVLNEATRPQVAAICARVSGMPLAIELAAGWADTLSLDAIAAELARGDELLVSQAPDLPARHRSVRLVWDATWARLSADEQATFAQLAVFRGGGTREAVEAVTGAGPALLQALVGKALLRYDPARARYTVHELLRQYAATRLAADAAAERGAHGRHAAHYLGALAAREALLKGGGQLQALDATGQDIENIQAAWRWAAGAGEVGMLTSAATSLSLAYEWLGRGEEGWAAFAQAATAVTPAAAPAPPRPLVQAAQARFAMLRGDGP